MAAPRIQRFHLDVAHRWDSEWTSDLDRFEDAVDWRRHVNLCISRYLRDKLTSRKKTSNNELVSIYLQLAREESHLLGRWDSDQARLSREMEFLELAFDVSLRCGKVKTHIKIVINILMLDFFLRDEQGKYHARAVSFMQQVRQLYGTGNVPRDMLLLFEQYDERFSVRHSGLLSVCIMIVNHKDRDDEEGEAGNTDAEVPSVGGVPAEGQGSRIFLCMCELYLRHKIRCCRTGGDVTAGHAASGTVNSHTNRISLTELYLKTPAPFKRITRLVGDQIADVFRNMSFFVLPKFADTK